MSWIKSVRLALFFVGIVNVAVYFTGGTRALFEIVTLVVCGGGVVLSYVEDPARFHQPVRLFRRRPRSAMEQWLQADGAQQPEDTPLWTNQGARLTVLLSILVGLVIYVAATRTDLLGPGSASSGDATAGAEAAECPSLAAPPVASVAPGGLRELRGDLRRLVLGGMRRRLYSLGTVTSENAWSDNFPQEGSLRLPEVARVPAAYEMRWWTTRTDLVDDVFVFDRASEARDFFELASSSRCRPYGAQVTASSPPGARDLVWRNPDRVFQEDVYLLRGNRVYRVDDVRDQSGTSQSSAEQQIGFSIASGLACALPEADCRAPRLQRHLALMSLTQR